jgi:hypothetical protein
VAPQGTAAYDGLDATELRLAPDLAALVATRRFP